MGGSTDLYVDARHSLRKLWGSAQSQMMIGCDSNLWVVKFSNNPQGSRILVNELLGTMIAQNLGLCVSRGAVLKVENRLIETNQQMYIDYGKWTLPCASGLQFGSLFVGRLLGLGSCEHLNDRRFVGANAFDQFTGVLAFDKWTGNIDRRQVVSCPRLPGDRLPHFVFVDQGSCFNGRHWKFRDSPADGTLTKTSVYSPVKGWSDFTPWLDKIRAFCPTTLWNIAEQIPPEWYHNRRSDLEQLVDGLLKRRSLIPDLISKFRHSEANPFPNWSGVSGVSHAI
jgi:hypothetical protein